MFHGVFALAIFPAILISALPGVSSAYAQSTLERNLRSTLAAKPHAQTQVGACVVDLKNGATVFEQDADQSFTPASVTKLFTMAAALETLGTDFAFTTRLATDGASLYVIGDGDPAFGDEKLQASRDETITADFTRWAETLTTAGVSTVPGDLVIDESIFDDQRVHPSWDENDLGKWYAAPIGGLNFNGNCVDITVSPSAKHGAAALVTVSPATSLIKIVNKCRTGNGRDPVLHHPPDTWEYIINGRCKKRWPFPSVAVPDPGLLFGDALRTVLEKHGIHIAGGIKRTRIRHPDGTLPPSLRVIAQRTTPLSDVLLRVGKNSQNLFAECLLKRTGFALAQRRGDDQPQGNWTNGQIAVRGLFRTAGIGESGFVIADGSGLSRENACTARQLVQLLTWMRSRPGGDLFTDSLSIAGVDGSLRKQLRDLPGRVFAKTGTMRGVRVLAGYVNDGSAPRFAFAVIFNGYKGPSTPYREIQERFCRTLVKAASTGTLSGSP